jgi:hypothetical protein
MLRFLNLIAIVALIGSAVYAYTIKYQTSYRAEQIAKTKIEIKTESDAIAVLRAEWAYMTRPERLQQLADQYLVDVKPLDVKQLVSVQALPDKAARSDMIGSKLDQLGLGLSATPPVASPAQTTTQVSSASKTVTAPVTKSQAANQERKKP